MSDRNEPEQTDPLGQAVRSLFSDLSLAGDAQADCAAETVRMGEAGRIEQGTRVRFSLRMLGGRVRQARYRAYGCPYTLACCEWLARRLCDAQLPEPPEALGAERLTLAVGTPTDWAGALGIPQARLGRLLVIEDALRAALAADPGSPAGVLGPGASGDAARLGRNVASHDATPAAASSPADDAMTKPG